MEQRKKHQRKYNADFSANTAYKIWKKVHRKLNIPQRVHGYIMKDFSIAIMNLMLTKNFEFRMPYRLGYLAIRKFRPKPKFDETGNLKKGGLPIDYGATQKLWVQQYPGLSREEIYNIPNKKLVYYNNLHTDGYLMKVVWDKKTVKVRNYKIYSIKLIKALRLYMGGVLKANPNLEFYELK